jgi:2-polyprenyl-6-methoxyphenol hydroxylase-like FAD-dependent oxidoreductase
MQTQQPRVLISGAGVGGPVLAYWLHRFGFAPTVIERTPAARVGSGGHAVDLFGPAVEVMEWMGILRRVQDARTRTTVISFVRPGRRPVDVPAEALSEGVSDRHIEIMRGDLAGILHDLTREHVDYVFDDSVTALQETGRAVEVTFERAAPRTFDLVVGADGLHSTTRRLAFGADDEFLRFLGGYLAVFTAPNYLRLDNRMLGFSAPGRAAGMYPVGDPEQTRVVLLWRSPDLHDYDRHDLDAQRRLVRGVYGDLGWELPRLLDELETAEDLYLDSISQIVMRSWTRGRVALVGDAGYCPGAAVGGGTSLAVIGAYVLAGELLAAGGDHARAFAAYERTLGPVVGHSRAIGPRVIEVIIPRSRAQIWLTAQAIRVLPHIAAPIRRRLTSFGGGAAAMLDEARLRRPEDLPAVDDGRGTAPAGPT